MSQNADFSPKKISQLSEQPLTGFTLRIKIKQYQTLKKLEGGKNICNFTQHFQRDPDN